MLILTFHALAPEKSHAACLPHQTWLVGGRTTNKEQVAGIHTTQHGQLLLVQSCTELS